MFKIRPAGRGFSQSPACRRFLMAGAMLWISGCGSDSHQETPGQSPGTMPTLTEAGARDLLSLQNRGLAHLQNHEWPDARSTLSEIARQLPDSPIAARNLAIGLTLALISADSDVKPADDPEGYRLAMEQAGAAALRLNQAARDDDDRVVAELLLAKQAAHQDATGIPRMDEALAAFDRALKLAPDRADLWFAKAAAMSGHRVLSESPSLIDALRKAHQLAPDNLAACIDLLEKQGLAANSRDPGLQAAAVDLRTTLENAARLIVPLNATILKQRRVDLIAQINKSISGSGAGNPALLAGPAQMVKNLVVPEVATLIDRRRIDRNLLEYVVEDLRPDLNLSPDTMKALSPSPPATVLLPFSEVRELPEVSGATAVRALDMNLDGADDLIIARDGRLQVYSRGTGNASPWTLLMESPPESPLIQGFRLADLDRDYDRSLSDVKTPHVLLDRDGDRRIVKDLTGETRWFDTDPDVIAWNSEGVVLLRNEKADDGTRSLSLIPQSGTSAAIRNVTVGDLEADGDLDLIIATASGLDLWKNLDGTTFEPVTSGITGPSHGIQSAAIVDWNHDIALDVVAITDDGRIGWMQNLMHGRFRWVDGTPGLPGGTAIHVEDLNRDGVWDLVLSGTSGTRILLMVSPDAGEVKSTADFPDAAGSSLTAEDLDNDGYTDFVLSGAGSLKLRRGTGSGLDPLDELLPAGRPESASTAASDLDDDGDLDLISITSDGRLAAYQNNGGNLNNWIDVVARPVGHDDQGLSNRVNMHAIGSIVEVLAGPSYQARIVDSPRVHLGIGSATSVDAIRVIWTDGIPQNVTDVALLRARLGILAPQILKGSCPFIYTWNGKRFEFFSDCLWAAPLGLIQATGDLAPTREWEYLLVPGRFLQPRDDRYVLQLTEELWEAAYFDEVKLVAVDHPQDVDIFTNEKVGSAELAAHRIHTVREPRLPLSVRDGTGRDLLPQLAAQDQVFVQPFRKRILQGLVDEWTMEFDLGELQSPDGKPPENVRLFLTGWVFPTDTQLNEAILQNPGLQPPAPPALEVPDSSGEWQTVRPFIGFPGGKTKSMVIDLSDAFLCPDYRVRIRSSMELYWDAVFFTVDEADATTAVHDCPLVSADLHYRGFSRRVYGEQSWFRGGAGPESYDYDAPATEPRWSEMSGRFTRYGAVTDLLTTADDRMVVMGPGDELTVEFDVPATDPPEGWTRDFVLYNVGWDKDAALNTVYGHSSEPLPVRSMRQYPFDPDDQQPPSEKYRQFLREYQTREYRRFQLRDALRRQTRELQQDRPRLRVDSARLQ